MMAFLDDDVGSGTGEIWFLMEGHTIIMFIIYFPSTIAPWHIVIISI